MKRLRWAMDEAALGVMYAEPHSDTSWAGHRLRTRVTVTMAMELLLPAESVVDLSCGDAVIARHLFSQPVLGDFAPGYPITGPIEETVERVEPCDVFVCTETIEHLDEPDRVLGKIRGKASRLLLSTPLEAWDDPNPEHYWAWSREDVEGIMHGAGWTPMVFVLLDTRPLSEMYQYGIWVCS